MHARKVKIGIEQGHFIQIIKGINPGEKVVVAGNEHLKNGVSVRVQGSTKDIAKKQKGSVNENN